MDNIVEIKNVYKSYSKKEVISNMNLNIPKGKIVGLLGPNGSGKSTLIKLINGLLQPNSGDVLIDGIKPSIETKRIVSYLPERTYLNDWMKVSDILNFFNDFYDDFDIDKICNYTEDKIKELEENKDIIRNKLKIKASINNTKIFKDIKEEYGSFKNYLLTFNNNKIYYEINMVSSELSDNLSKDLRKRGMTFVGTMIIYSYLQAIGIIYSHDMDCYLYREESNENS